jgi:hypothetical protein
MDNNFVDFPIFSSLIFKKYVRYLYYSIFCDICQVFYLTPPLLLFLREFSVAEKIFLMMGDKKDGVRNKTIFINNPPCKAFITLYARFYKVI